MPITNVVKGVVRVHNLVHMNKDLHVLEFNQNEALHRHSFSKFSGSAGLEASASSSASAMCYNSLGKGIDLGVEVVGLEGLCDMIVGIGLMTRKRKESGIDWDLRDVKMEGGEGKNCDESRIMR